MAADRQRLLDKAERLASRGKLNAAIDVFRKVINAFPDDTSSLNRVGDLYVRLKRIDDAIELFRLAAENFEHQGFFVKAIAINKKILRIDTSQLEVSEGLADLQHRQGLLSDARRQYQAVADSYQNRGDIESAIAVHRKLVDLEPDDPGHRLHLAELLKGQDRIPEAMGQYKGIADVFLTRGLAEEAVKVCLQALVLAPQNTDFIAGVARELNAAGYLEQAESFLEVAAENNPEAGQISLQPVIAKAEQEPETEEESAVAEEEVEVEEVEVEEIEAEEVESEEVEIDEAIEVGEEEEAAAEDEVEIEFEIDLEDFEIEAEETVEEEVEVEEEPAVEIEAEEPAEVEEPEEVVVEAATEEPEDESLKELLVEADVLIKYELEDKAIEKLEEILVAAPQHLPSYQKLIDLLFARGSLERVAKLALLFKPLAEEAGQADQWVGLESQLVEAGFVFEDDRWNPPEPAKPEPEPEPVETEESVEEVAVEAGAGAEDLSWLDDVPAQSPGETAGESQGFDSEEEFFDLASELERELDSEPGVSGDLEIVSDEQSIAEIVEGFRKGMAETLSPEDYDTHYNLGIAYREMGLVDEAISEFQLAAKDSRYLIDCCSLLASCFVKKGFPQLAIKWYSEGLDSPTISQEEVLGLQYELGDLYLEIGEAEEARQRFVEIYGVNSDYRDVSSKLASLEQTQ